VPAKVVVTEMDSTYLKRQQRGRAAGSPVAHFPMHFGLHHSGRLRRYNKRSSPSVRLQNKRWIPTALRRSLRTQTGPRAKWQRSY
jgi:hypothetical protein